jgi:hypothetical protein
VPLPLPAETYDAGAEECRIRLYARSRTDGMDHALPLTARADGTFVMSADAVLDPAALPQGTWDLIARLDAGGWTIERRLTGDVRIPPRGALEPYRTENGKVSIRVRPVRSGLRRMVHRLRALAD